MEQADAEFYGSVAGFGNGLLEQEADGHGCCVERVAGWSGKPFLSPSQEQMLPAVRSRDIDRGVPPVETRSNGLESREVGENVGCRNAAFPQPQVLTARYS